MAILTIDTDDKRDVRALELATQADRWHQLADGAFGILSSDGYDRYKVTADTCTCEDSRRGNLCKHRRAVRIFAALTKAVDQARPAESYYCQCSASGDQGSCGFVSDEATELQDHSRDVHGWELDRAVVESMRGRKPLSPAEAAALFARL